MHQHFHQIHTTAPSMSSSHPYTAVDDDDDTDICPVCDGQCTCPNFKPAPLPPLPSLKIKFTLPPSLRQSASVPLKKRGRPPKLPPKVTQSLKARAAVSKKVAKRTRQNSYSSDTDHHHHHSFPTFVSASAISSSISSSSDSSSSSESHFHSDADSDIQAEEENFIVADIHHKARLRRELLGGDEPPLKKRSPTHDWVIRPRKKSVAGSEIDTDPQDDDQLEDDDEEDDQEDDEVDEEDEPDAPMEEDDEDTDQRHHYVGLATGWSEEEDESSFDADLFFANLSDSSSTSSSDSSTPTRRRCRHSYTPGAIDADQSSSTSDSPIRTALPFEVTEGWDGQLTFTNGEAESRGIVDIDFEKDTERYADDDDDDTCSSYSSSHGDHPNSHPLQVPDSTDIDMLSISDADAGYEEEDGEVDEGDTTEEELIGDDCLPNERAMKLFTLPMPMPVPMGMGMGMGIGLSAINPMSTVSPSIGLEKRRHRRGKDVDGDREERKRWRRRLRLGTTGHPRAAGKLFWGDESTTGGYASSSSSDSVVKASKGKGKGKQKAFFSPSSSPTFHVHHPPIPRTGVFVPTGETRQAIIGEGRKGADVPSPHPRFNGKRGRVSVIQYLLKKHAQSQSQSPVALPDSNGGSSPSIVSDAPSPFHHLLLSSSSAASPLTGTEDTANDEYDTGASTPCPCPVEDETTCIVELDDVLEASFLDDPMDREYVDSSSLAPNSAGLAEDSPRTPTRAGSTAVAEASNKHLTRWDVISIGAFRQTREQQQQQAWGPGSRSSPAVTDYGSAIKSGASALLWQNSGAGLSKKISSIPSSSRSSTKAAKRRRLMASSAMSSPLVLPLSSTSLSTPPLKPHSSSCASHSQPNPTTNTHKTRKELRREKKLLKKKTTSSSPSSAPQQSFFFTTHHPHAAHPNNASNNNNNHHQFHTHQHYPNLKTRGMSSSQRMGFAGGAVPPLNL